MYVISIINNVMGIYCTHSFYFYSDAKWETIHVAVLMRAQYKS